MQLRISSCLVLFALPALASPPTPIPESPLPPPGGITETVLNISSTADIRRGTSLHLTRDHMLDAVIVVDDGLEVVYGPSAYGHTYPLTVSEPVRDVATLARFAPHHQDALLYLTPSGVHAYVEAETQGDYVSQPVAVGAPYAGGVRMNVGFDPGTGLQSRVAVLDSTRRQLHTFNVPSNFLSGGTITTGPIITSPRDILDFTPVRWCDDDATEEYALLTTLGVEVYNTLGNRVAFFRDADMAGTQVAGGVLFRIRQTNLAYDRLVWITPKSASTSEQWLFTLDATGYEVPSDLGTHVVYSGCGVDDDLDGRDDAFLAYSSTQEAAILHNTGSNPASVLNGNPPTFSLGTSTITFATVGDTTPTTTPTSPTIANHAWPVAGDYAGDGDVDVLFPVAGTGKAKMRNNQSINAALSYPQLDKWLALLDANDNLMGSFGVPCFMRLIVRSNPPAGATGVEITVWKGANDLGPYGANSDQHSLFDIATAQTSGAKFGIFDHGFIVDTKFAGVMRWVKTDANGDIERAWPARVFQILNPLDMAALDDEIFENALIYYSEEELENGGPLPGKVTSGGQVTIPQVTPLPPGNPPRP